MQSILWVSIVASVAMLSMHTLFGVVEAKASHPRISVSVALLLTLTDFYLAIIAIGFTVALPLAVAAALLLGVRGGTLSRAALIAFILACWTSSAALMCDELQLLDLPESFFRVLFATCILLPAYAAARVVSEATKLRSAIVAVVLAGGYIVAVVVVTEVLLGH